MRKFGMNNVIASIAKQSLLAISLSIAIVACSDDDSATKPLSLPSEVADMDELEDYKCNLSLIGEIVYVRDKRKNYECDGDHWFESYNQPKSSSSVKNSSSSNKQSSSSKKQGDGGSRSTSSGQAESVMSSSSSAKSSSSFMSSSSAKSSSSSKKGCKTETEDNCKYGELVDNRDGQTYKTVKIGYQWWMAENLNYETDSSFCYNDSVEYCEKYGRLYRWAAVVGKSESKCGSGNTCSLPSGNIRGVCPSGWHLPDSTEWNTLFDAVGGQSTAGKMLKSTSGWNDSGNGTDAFGFSALPAGYRLDNGWYYREGKEANFWSSTEHIFNEVAYDLCLYDDDNHAYLPLGDKRFGSSVRCLQD